MSRIQDVYSRNAGFKSVVRLDQDVPLTSRIQQKCQRACIWRVFWIRQKQPIAATCSHLVQFPLAAFPRRICNILRWTAPENSQHSPVGASGCKCLLGASGCKWLQVAARVAAQVAAQVAASGCSGCKWLLGANGCKWRQVAAQVAASGCKWLQGSPLEANFCHFAAPRPAIEFLFWDHWETAVLGQILAGSLLEANFYHLVAARSKWLQVAARGLQVAASGCKWLLGANGCKWLQVAASGSKWLQENTGKFSTFSGGSKWLQVAAGSKWL